MSIIQLLGEIFCSSPISPFNNFHLIMKFLFWPCFLVWMTYLLVKDEYYILYSHCVGKILNTIVFFKWIWMCNCLVHMLTNFFSFCGIIPFINVRWFCLFWLILVWILFGIWVVLIFHTPRVLFLENVVTSLHSSQSFSFVCEMHLLQVRNFQVLLFNPSSYSESYDWRLETMNIQS
jgi:hypothetical protein